MKFSSKILNLLITVALALVCTAMSVPSFAQDDISISTGIIGNGRLLGAKTYDGQLTVGILGIDSSGNTTIKASSGKTVTIPNGISPTGSIIPTVTNTYDLGSSSLRWRSGYFGTSLDFADGGVLRGPSGNAGTVYFNGGSGTTTASGGLITAAGASAGVNPGDLNLESGTTSGGEVFIRANGTAGGNVFAVAKGTTGDFIVRTSNSETTRLTIDENGLSTFTGNIAYTTANTGTVDVWATLAAAGTSISDAAQIASTRTTVTGASGTNGVKAALLSIGQSFSAFNSSGSVLLFYPPTGSVTLGNGNGTALSIASNATVTCFYESATVGRCTESPPA